MRKEGIVGVKSVARHGIKLVGRDAPIAHLEVAHVALVNQALQLDDKILGLAGKPIAHQTRHVDVAVIAHVGVDHMLMIGHADHDEARPMRQAVMVRAHGVFRSVAARATRANHSVAAQGIGKSKLRARMEVKPVMHGGKRHGSASDAFTANDIAHGSVRIVDIALHAVEQGIEPPGKP